MRTASHAAWNGVVLPLAVWWGHAVVMSFERVRSEPMNPVVIALLTLAGLIAGLCAINLARVVMRRRVLPWFVLPVLVLMAVLGSPADIMRF